MTPTYSEELIRTVMMKDPACRSAAAVVLGSPCYQAQMLHRAARWCRLQGWAGLGGVCTTIGRMLTGIDIDPTAKIGRRVFMRAGLGAVIGAGVEVGDDCEIGAFATIEPATAGEGAPILESGVKVGAGARIVGAVRIAAGAVVPPNAVVANDYPCAEAVQSEEGASSQSACCKAQEEQEEQEKQEKEAVALPSDLPERSEATSDKAPVALEAPKVEPASAAPEVLDPVPDAPNTAALERLASEAERRVADFEALVDARRHQKAKKR